MADTSTQEQEREVTRAQEVKRQLLERITQATDDLRRQEDRLQDARHHRARMLQEAQRSGLTTPGERQSAANISKQHRQALEAIALPPRQPDPRTADSYTDPLPGVD